MATVLVTGGAGFIGSILVTHLLAAGHTVRVLDCLLFGGVGLRGVVSHPNFSFIQGDIRNADDVHRATEGADTIVHLAAIVGDPACSKSPDLAATVNRDGSERLLETALGCGVRRFIFASTCSNYGKTGDPDEFVDETSPLRPVSLYAELKVAFEKKLLAQSRSDFTPVVLRFATAYGVSPRPRFDLVVNEFSRDLHDRKVLEVFGETFWRPYCHIADIARAVQLAVEADREVVCGIALNVGSTQENFRKKDVVDLILHILPDRAQYVKYVARSEDPRDYRVNFEKIRDTLGFVPRVSVRDGIIEIIEALDSGIVSDSYNEFYRNDRPATYDSLRKKAEG